MTTFHDFDLNEKLLRVLDANAFTTPTPVQEAAIPAVLDGHDVMACAQTGTGKTAAFVLPALHRIISGPSDVRKQGGPRVLVLTPTRELAQQVADNIRLFAKDAQVKSGVIVGGVSYGPQYRLLENSLDFLVATPGRLIDHMNEDRVDFGRVEMVVLDEADRMVDMGFLKPVERILAAINKVAPAGRRPQMLLFSATFTPSVAKVGKQVLDAPVSIDLAPARSEHSQITQKVFRADGPEHKLNLLHAMLKDDALSQIIVFAATKYGSDKLARKLEQSGIPSAALHGGMKQNARKRTLEQMHKGKLRVLVATDVAARGIDVKQLSHVINFDLPQVAEDYVHRIGRTGRGGETGIAISFVAPTDVPMLRDIEKLLGKRMELAHMPGLEPQLAEDEFARQGKAAPRSRQGQRQPREGGSLGGRGGRFSGPRREERAEGSRGFNGDRGGYNGGERGFGSRDGARRDSFNRDGASRDGGDRAPRSEGRFDRPRSERSDTRRDEGQRFGGPRSEGRNSRPARGFKGGDRPRGPRPVRLDSSN